MKGNNPNSNKTTKKQTIIVKSKIKGLFKTKNKKRSKLWAAFPLSYIILYVIILPRNIIPLLKNVILKGISIPWPLDIGAVLFLCGMPLLIPAAILILIYLDL
jgi:hypothetical protein